MPSGLFAIIPGFGGPNVDTKIEILRLNLRAIQAYTWQHLKLRICVYDDTQLPLAITNLPFVEVVREPGIVGEFLMRHADPSTIEPCFDTVLMLLDDVLLASPFPWDNIFKWKNEFHLDIMSPALTKDSKFVYPYMLQNTETSPAYTLRIMRVCEFFCYIMDRASYTRFYSHLDNNNPWLWGLDLIMEKHLHLRVGIMNTVLMKHFYQGECYKCRPDKKPTDGYNYVLQKYGEDGDEALRNQQHTKYIIFQCS